MLFNVFYFFIAIVFHLKVGEYVITEKWAKIMKKVLNANIITLDSLAKQE